VTSLIPACSSLLELYCTELFPNLGNNYLYCFQSAICSYEKFCGLVTFLSHVAPYYPDHCPMLPTQLMTLLQQHGQVLHQDTRVTTLQALLLLRNRGLLEAAVIFPLLFELFELQDKALRSLAYQHLVSDIRKV